MTTVKQAFEARLKRRVAAHPELYPQYGKSLNGINEKGNREALARLIEAVKGKPFWIWDDKQHDIEHQRHNGLCCFNHIIPAGLPIKNGIRHSFYDYQKLMIDTLEQYKRLYLLKAGGIGATELFLRYMAYLCLSSDKYSNSQMIILTGPRIDLSISLVRRLKALFYPAIIFEDKETVLHLGDVRIEAFPSHYAIHSARGLPNVSFILADEAAWFNPAFEAMSVIDRYVLKNDCLVGLISSPFKPGDLMEQIQKQSEQGCQYKRLYMDISVAINKLFTVEEVEQARRTSLSFEREFNLSFIPQYGNVHSPLSVDRCIALAESLQIKEEGTPEARKCLGIDVGWGSSAMAFCLTQSINNVISVLYAEMFMRPDYDQMLALTLDLLRKYYKVNVVMIDSSAPEYISGLKRSLHERPDYLEHISELRKRYPNNPTILYRMMKVHPIPFSTEHRRLLSNTKQWMDDERNPVAIPAKFDKLLMSIRTATATDSTILDKQATVYDDLYDAFRLSMNYWIWSPQTGT